MLSNVSYRVLILSVSALLFTACGIGTEETDMPADSAKNYSVNSFSAKYYFEDDGTEPGVGTDGNDASIVPVLMYTETVERPAINYIYDYEFGIDSYNLYVQWEGNITAYEDVNLSANFDLSWSDVSFYLDDTLVSQWANSKQVFPITLTKGEHHIRIEYHNHWHTTYFNASFTDYPETTVSEDISSILSDTTQISFLRPYETDYATSIHNEVVITLPQSNRPQMLFLGSYHAINWIINNPYNTELKGVVFNAYAPGTTVSNAGGALILNATDLAGYGDAEADAIADVVSMTGKEPEYFNNDYSMVNIDIPAL